MTHIIIIGNGIAGITAARHIRKLSDHKITVISKESKYFFSRTALMYAYMGHMKFEHLQPYENWFWKKNNIDLVHDLVKDIDIENQKIILYEGKNIIYDKLVLATGSKPNKFGWPGENALGVSGLYHKQDLEYIETITPKIKRAVIVGGGLIGIELAEMFRSKNIEVTFLVRENSFWANVLPEGESSLINRHIIEHGIDLRLNTELKEIEIDKNGWAKGIITSDGEKISCEYVGLTAGVSPNIEFIKKTAIATNKGVLVNEYLETNITNIYAIGDCSEHTNPKPGRRPIEAVWYAGRMMGETLARTLTGNKTKYEPGHWFNSAKFLDIEYQTYGVVLAKERENEKHFYWEHHNGKIAMRINYDTKTNEFIGINTFGIRLRHELFDTWLTEKRNVHYVLKHLKNANFDPEFYQNYEQEIVKKFNSENNTSIQLNKRNWKQILPFIH